MELHYEKITSFNIPGVSGIFAFIFLFLLIISGCKQANRPSTGKGKTNASLPATNNEYFQEIGQEIGLDFIHSIGGPDLNNIVESSCGGTAFLDYDQDGYIDIYVCSGTWLEGFTKSEKPEILPGNHLYRNQGDGTFKDVTRKAGVGGPWYSMGATVGDYNNDGFPDLYLSNYGYNVLLKNKGNGTFTDVTERAKLTGEHTCSAGAVWLDYDNDSYLDLYVGNYLEFDPEYKYFYAPDGFPPPMAYKSEPDVLYHNKGDGTFEDVTQVHGNR